MLRGIDTSHWKSDLDLNNISFDFILTKATGGTGYVDDQCDRFVQTAITLGKKWGVFHYFGDGFNDNDPIAEADWFINNCRGYFGKGQIWLDWERGGNPSVNRIDMALAWLEHVRITTGYKPAGVYMSNSVISDYDWSPVINAGYALWDAAYVDDTTVVPNYQMDFNRDPNPHWDGNINDVLWQFTSTGRLDGYGGNLDCNFFYGSRAAWDAYAGIHATPVPEPTTTTTTTEAPTPEPTTTTTTVAPDPTPSPEPSTTTTTTVEPQPEPSTTTTTTAGKPVEPPVGFWAGVVAFFVWLLNKLQGNR